MKKLICILLTLAMALSLVACGSKEEKSVFTEGSTSMQKVINAPGEAYMEETGASFTYNATGSGTGIKAVKDGTCDIGLSSRYLKDSEKAISVGGVAPGEATIKDGSYAVQRPFVLVTREGAQLSETAQDFFDFAISSAAYEIISAAGVVPAH